MWPTVSAVGAATGRIRRPTTVTRPPARSGCASTPSPSWAAKPSSAELSWRRRCGRLAASPTSSTTQPICPGSAEPPTGSVRWSRNCNATWTARRPSGRWAVNADRPDPRAIGAGAVRSDGHPDTSRGDHRPAVSGQVSTLDRITLRLGVAVAVVIALCSYAVSATSLYALGVQAGYSPWQAAAVPVVADGPAIYGMFRIVSRSRRGAKGAGYGWLLVGCGTLASIGGNVAHAQPNLVARAIAAAIPLAVLEILEGLKGDAGEVTRLSRAADLDPAAGLLEPGHLPVATTIRRSDP